MATPDDRVRSLVELGVRANQKRANSRRFDSGPTPWQEGCADGMPTLTEAPAGPNALTRANQFTFFKQALATLLATLFVVLFGAVVRITGSGAGCGQHWPSCQGEIAHLPRSIETLIELSHRVTSGVAALLVFWLTWTARQRFPAGSGVRRATVAASVLMLVEALIGAALVKLALVGMNASTARAVVMPLHLVTTSALLAALALCTWWARPQMRTSALHQGPRALAWGALSAIVLTSGTGAITALGDTVYPVPESASALAALEGAGHFLERLRVVHPVVAILSSVVLFWLASRALDTKLSLGAQRCARAVLWLACLQVAVGSVNVWLSAPGWLQVVHLAMASTLWIAVVLLTSELYLPSQHAAP